MLNRKSKMINVRLSTGEYSTLLDVCRRRGENISELIRTTMQQVFPGDLRAGDHDLLEIWNRVENLETQVEQLRRLIAENSDRSASQ